MMTDQDGYTVDTTAGPRGFRDGTLADVAGALPDIRQVIAAAGLDPGTFPAVVADAVRRRDLTLGTMLRTVEDLTGSADGHLAGLTRTAAAYDGAEAASVDLVGGRSPVRPASPAGAERTAGTGAAAADAPAGRVGPDSVLGLYRRLEALCGTVGLASAVHPIGALLAANVRDPRPFGHAALRLHQVHTSADRLHGDVPRGLDALSAEWTGRAHDAHRDATLNAYQPHLAELRDHARTLAEKDWQSRDAQQRFHDRVVIILGWALLLAAAFVFMIAINVLQKGPLLIGLTMLLAGIVIAVKGAVMALYTDWPQ